MVNYLKPLKRLVLALIATNQSVNSKYVRLGLHFSHRRHLLFMCLIASKMPSEIIKHLKHEIT